MASQVTHFSHRHPLTISETHDEEDIKCSGCELHLSGESFICTKPSCNFFLHKSCSELPRTIRHKSHPKHPLTLFISPPYADAEFTCDACRSSGQAFTYHCSVCRFDLHVDCASLPEVMEDGDDHEHPLGLFYSSAFVEATRCSLCGGLISNKGWIYSCFDCKYVTHLGCVESA